MIYRSTPGWKCTSHCQICGTGRLVRLNVRSKPFQDDHLDRETQINRILSKLWINMNQWKIPWMKMILWSNAGWVYFFSHSLMPRVNKLFWINDQVGDHTGFVRSIEKTSVLDALRFTGAKQEVHRRWPVILNWTYKAIIHSLYSVCRNRVRGGI